VHHGLSPTGRTGAWTPGGAWVPTPGCPGLVQVRPPRTRVEARSWGFDPALCGIGATPSGEPNAAGLRVPTLATTSHLTRYLFQLCTLKLPPGQVVNLVGLSQTLQLGTDTNDGTPPVYPVTKLVGRAGAGNPNWSFPDGNVSWHVRLIRQPPLISPAQMNVLSCDSFAWTWSDTPALVFDTATFNAQNLDGNGRPDNYVDLTGYTPPYGGKIPGEPVAETLGTFTDLRFPPDDPSKQSIEPVVVEGPGALVFLASVWQTNPDTRAVLTVPQMFPIDPEMPEEGFIAAWPASVYWRIGGGMVIER
jgi:hypothetical protein